MSIIDEVLRKNDVQEARRVDFPSYEAYKADLCGMRQQSNFATYDQTYAQRSAYAQPEQNYYIPQAPVNDIYYVRQQAPVGQYMQDAATMPQQSYGYAPVYQPVQRNEMQQSFSPAINSETAKEAELVKNAEHTRRRGRLSLKGKLILGAYVMCVVAVAALIIAYAGKINSGKAVVPSSSAKSTQAVQESHNDADLQINSEYEVKF